MPWYQRMCSGCGDPVAAATDDPHARVLCGGCAPSGLPVSPADETGPMTTGQLRETLAGFMDLNGAWGANLGDGKHVLLEVPDGMWELAKVKCSFRYGRLVLVLEAGRREHIL
jgi:hypothetical protein